MFHLDNNSGVSAMPPVGTVQSSAPRWFTEGGGGTPASYPGADWYNIIQAELLNFLSAYGIAPDKADFSQLRKAIEAAIKDKATAKSPLLTAIAALVTSADKMPYFNGKDTVAMTALTAFAREVLAQTDAAGVLSKLGLGTAAKREVGMWPNQIPDMGFFQAIAVTGNTLLKFPFVDQYGNAKTIMVQFVTIQTTGGTDKGYPLPYAFPSMGLFATGNRATSGYNAAMNVRIANATTVSIQNWGNAGALEDCCVIAVGL